MESCCMESCCTSSHIWFFWLSTLFLRLKRVCRYQLSLGTWAGHCPVWTLDPFSCCVISIDHLAGTLPRKPVLTLWRFNRAFFCVLDPTENQTLAMASYLSISFPMTPLCLHTQHLVQCLTQKSINYSAINKYSKQPNKLVF